MLARVTLVALVPLCMAPVFGQELPKLSTPAKGETVNMSVQNGSRSSLSFGSSASFGTSTSLNATSGTSVSSSSSLAPAAGGTLTFTIGSGPNGVTSANIDNLKSQGSGETSIGGSPINAKDSNFSSGKADLTGVQSQLNVTLDSTRTGFQASSNTLHSSYGAVDGHDGAQIKPGGSTEDPAINKDTSQTSNSSANASINSTTNVDINSTSFTSVFLQAF